MKKIGVLGTGMVGNTIGSKLVQLGYEVMMGSRTATNEKAQAWKTANGEKASVGTFEDAAKFGEIIFNCTKGDITLDVFKMAGTENFDGKTYTWSTRRAAYHPEACVGGKKLRRYRPERHRRDKERVSN